MGRPHTFVIAEIGVNHNGSVQMAKKLIDSAVAAGADAVKFQSFQADCLVNRTALKAEYQKGSETDTEPQYEMLRKLQLSKAAHVILYQYCQTQRIEFMSTPFDLASLHLLANELCVKRLKVASGEVTNLPLLVYIGRTKLPVILSTGMCFLGEVERALAALAFGYLAPTAASPTLTEIYNMYSTEAAQAVLSEKVSLLHTTSAYPTPVEQTNLRAMDTLLSAFQLPVGLSDHTRTSSAALAAVARGAAIIEKHITLDCTLAGPDHAASMEPAEFTQFVQSIREVESALGSPIKQRTPGERLIAKSVRKSIVAAKAIAKGEVFDEYNLAVKRPETGISSIYYWELLGRAATRSYEKDELIQQDVRLGD